MATLMVQHAVKDRGARPSDTDRVLVLPDVPTADQAQGFADRAELKAARPRAGVAAPPSIATWEDPTARRRGPNPERAAAARSGAPAGPPAVRVEAASPRSTRATRPSRCSAYGPSSG